MASLIKDVDNVYIYGGSFNINQQHLGLERLLPYIAPDAFHNSAVGFELPKCYPGTRKAIKKDLIEWVQNIERCRPICHLYAPAGSGKTAIAKTLSDHFSSSDAYSHIHLLASFFFSRTVEGRNNVRRFIATIAYQVAVNLPCTKRFVIEAVLNDPAIFDKDLRSQMEKLILEPLSKACTLPIQPEREAERLRWPRLLVIDGLDECYGEENQVELLSVISNLAHRRPFPMAIFISCRPEIHIRRVFQELDLLNRLSIKISLSNEYSSKDDIRLFLESKFAEIRDAHSQNMTFSSDWPGKEILNTLVRKSSGHFIYASVVAKYVGMDDDNPVERLKVVLGLAETVNDEKPFTQLDALYMHILESIKPKHLPIITDAFSFSLEPSLWLEQPGRISMNGQLLLDGPDLRVGLAKLKGILIDFSLIPFHGIHVDFLHSSFSDFLLDSDRSGKYHISVGEAHANIAVYILNHHIIGNSVSEGLSKTAIASLVSHLPIAAPKNELYYQLQCLNHPQMVVNVIKLCNSPDEHGVFFDAGAVLQGLICSLGKSRLKDASDLSNNLWKTMQDCIKSELRKYSCEPLNHLLALVMSGASFPRHGQEWLSLCRLTPPRKSSLFSTDVPSASFLWTSFDFLGDTVRTVDESSLNLRRLLVEDSDQHAFRQMIRGSGHTVGQCVYAGACDKALGCIARLDRGMGHQLDVAYMTLASELSSVLESAEDALKPLNPDNLYFTRILTDVIVPLLKLSGPSQEIVKHLEDLSRVIGLLCHCIKESGFEREAKEVRAAVQQYLLKNSSVSGRILLTIERYLFG